MTVGHRLRSRSGIIGRGGHDGIARELACGLQLTVAPRSWSWLLAALDTGPLTALVRGQHPLTPAALAASPVTRSVLPHPRVPGLLQTPQSAEARQK
jgi:hypothetical protein